MVVFEKFKNWHVHKKICFSCRYFWKSIFFILRLQKQILFFFTAWLQGAINTQGPWTLPGQTKRLGVRYAQVRNKIGMIPFFFMYIFSWNEWNLHFVKVTSYKFISGCPLGRKVQGPWTLPGQTKRLGVRYAQVRNKIGMIPFFFMYIFSWNEWNLHFVKVTSYKFISGCPLGRKVQGPWTLPGQTKRLGVRYAQGRNKIGMIFFFMYIFSWNEWKLHFVKVISGSSSADAR